MKRREFISVLAGAAIAAPRAVFAQQPEKVFRIGFLGAASASGDASIVAALRTGLGELGGRVTPLADGWFLRRAGRQRAGVPPTALDIQPSDATGSIVVPAHISYAKAGVEIASQ